MANIVDPDVTARNQPSHLDLHCLHRCLFWSAWLKGLRLLIPLYVYIVIVYESISWDYRIKKAMPYRIALLIYQHSQMAS